MKNIWNESGSVGYSTSFEAVMIPSAKEKKSKAVISPTIANNMGNLSPWGSDNLFPQNLIRQARKSTLIPPTIVKQAHMLQSSGLIYGRVVDYDKAGNEVLEYKRDAEVEAWMRKTNIKRYLREASLSYHWFFNLFPELILSKDRKEIVSIHSQRPEYCRWEKQNLQTGNVDHAYISACWEMLGGDTTDKRYVTKVQTIDPYFDTAYHLQNGNDWKYIYPLSYPSPGSHFYQLQPWYGAIESGWFDITMSVPAFKKALFKNQITIKYIIEVSTWWWNWQYPGFDGFDQDKKRQIMNDELDMFERFMKSEENTGKSLMTTYQSDPQMQKKYDGWTVTAIDNKLKDSIYIEDSQEACSHLLYALGWDPTLTGPIPGRNGMGAGSGSDKRVAGEMYLSMIEPHRDVILEPIQMIFDYNWPEKELKVKFRNARVTTQDEGKGLKTDVA